MTHEWARVAGRAAATFFAGWFGPWAAAGANAMITGYEVWLAGGSSQDIHKASAISFATSMAFNFVGDGAAAIAKGGNVGGAIAFKIVGHAAVGCASASASGGECGPGALSAGFGAAATVATSGNFFATVIAGGIGAELGGGKFANGALTAAMGYLSNCVAHECWAQGVDAHQSLETDLKKRGEGFKFRGFYDSDNNAFLGFPDAYRESDKMVWELKPDTPYGRLTGPEQIARYTAISGYSPGTAGPIFGLSDTLVLSGRLGSYTYTYGGNPSRLGSVTDPVSGLRVKLQYFGDLVPGNPACPGLPAWSGSAQPVGSLCAIYWWDGRVTRMTYYPGDWDVSVARKLFTMDTTNAADNGNVLLRELTYFGYDGAGRLNAYKGPYDQWLTDTGQVVSPYTDSTAVYTYDANGRVTSVQAPRRSASQAPMRHTYSLATLGVGSYGPGTSTVQTGTSTTPSVLTGSSTFDEQGRVTSTADAGGRVTTQVWAPGSATHGKDLVRTVTSAQGRQQQNLYDNLGRLTESYGPCPAASYGADRRPLANTKCPGTTSVYDGENGTTGTQGLSALFWNDPTVTQGTPTRRADDRHADADGSSRS